MVKFKEIELSRVESSPTNEKSLGSSLNILPKNKIHSNEEVPIIVHKNIELKKNTR